MMRYDIYHGLIALQNFILRLGRSLLIPYSLSDMRMLLLTASFSRYKLIIDSKIHK